MFDSWGNGLSEAYLLDFKENIVTSFYLFCCIQSHTDAIFLEGNLVFSIPHSGYFHYELQYVQYIIDLLI